jgi:hypothetical protein
MSSDPQHWLFEYRYGDVEKSRQESYELKFKQSSLQSGPEKNHES